MIRKFRLSLLAIAVAFVLAEDSAFAQIGGSGIGGMMGAGNRLSRPKHKIHKPKAPVLSPALNLVPGVITSFEGQFLLRQLPQEQALRNSQQTANSLDTLQGEIADQNNQIKSGLNKTTGHSTRFMNYGSYYSLGGRSSGGRGRGG